MTPQEIQKAYRIARSIVSKVQPRGERSSLEAEDLLQAGVLHLWRRRDRPRAEDLPWSSWAGQIIHFGVQNAIREQELKAMSQATRVALAQMGDAVRALQHKLLREPTRAEVAEYLETPRENIDEAYVSRMRVVSESGGNIHAPGGMEYEHRLECRRNRPDVQYELLEQAQMLRAAVKELPPLQRVVAEQVLFEGRAKKDIAAEQGVSQSSVSQALRLGVQKLTERMKETR